MKITAIFEIDVDIEAWAKAKGMTVEQARDDALDYFAGHDLASSQTFATQIRSSAIENL